MARNARQEKRRRRIGGGETDFHVLRLVMRPTARDERILNHRLLAIGMLERAFLRLLLKRANAMHRDPAWAAARLLPPGSPERVEAFKAVRAAHGLDLNTMGASELAKTLWRGAADKRARSFEAEQAAERASAEAEDRRPRKLRAPVGWMPSVFATRVAGASGKAVWKSVDEWLYGKRGRPKLRPPHLCRTAWNEDARSGMFLDGDVFCWNQAGGSHRKDLRVRLAKREDSAWWAKHLEDRRVLSVGVTEDAGVWYCLLRVAGKPFRDPEYLAAVARGESVGMDAAPTDPAFVGGDDGFVGTLASPEARERQRALDAQVRRLQRAQDRSRRATNPYCYDEQGRHIKGRRPRRKSKTYKARQRQLRKLQRRATAQRRTDAEALTRKVMTLGTRVAVEKTNHRAWQTSGLKLGARMRFTRPGETYARLRAETALLGGAFLELPTGSLALSQHCLCGERVKKPLSQRVHHCEQCGLGPLHRDLFSAFLAHLILSYGLAPEDVNLSEGLFDSPDNRARALRLCGVPSTGHKGPASAGASRLAALTDAPASDKAEQSACQRSVSDLAPLAQGAARQRSNCRGSEETRPLDSHATRRGSRPTASGGDTTPNATGPPPAVLAR